MKLEEVHIGDLVTVPEDRHPQRKYRVYDVPENDPKGLVTIVPLLKGYSYRITAESLEKVEKREKD